MQYKPSDYSSFMEGAKRRREAARRMRQDGAKISHIAEKLGVTRQRVQQYLSGNGAVTR